MIEIVLIIHVMDIVAVGFAAWLGKNTCYALL